jgi:2'-5' RNA ligase
MTEPIRAFIAITLPDSLVGLISEVQQKLKKNGLRISWVSPENVHLTLKFLGDIAPDDIDPITAVMAECAPGLIPMLLAAGGIGVFPDLRRARILWMGITGDMSQLVALQKNLELRLAALGNGRFKPEDRPFKGHLTLGRIKSRVDYDILVKAMRAVGQIASSPFTVDTIHLIQSQLTPTGAIYTPLRAVRLDDSGKDTL